MTLKEPIYQLFTQLKAVICQLDPAAYNGPISALSNASIGQHIRHVIELFFELENGYKSGTIDYELRKRDFRLESDPSFALLALDEIRHHLHQEDKPLILVSDYSMGEADKTLLTTTYYRELIYNIEHTVHHMALIRVGWMQLWDRPLPAEFGVAVSTLKYRQAIASRT